MFGESESESPRAGSPWDSFLEAPNLGAFSKSSSVKYDVRADWQGGQALPKLIPELEEGNVEYKLKLINPSPERFARLVTQLKWRLLEGGGQAYYELGVADSGHLVGLSRQELEQTLQTLEEMAGEIGASVIVVKEIEVPAVLSGWSERKPFGALDNAVRAVRRVLSSGDVAEGIYSTTTDAETETELSTPDMDDVESDFDGAMIRRAEKNLHHPNNIGLPSSYPQTSILSSLKVLTRSQSNSPYLSGVEGDLDIDVPPVKLEISAVYKPRPTRRRKPKEVMRHNARKGKSNTNQKDRDFRPTTGVKSNADFDKYESQISRLSEEAIDARSARLVKSNSGVGVVERPTGVNIGSGLIKEIPPCNERRISIAIEPIEPFGDSNGSLPLISVDSQPLFLDDIREDATGAIVAGLNALHVSLEEDPKLSADGHISLGDLDDRRHSASAEAGLIVEALVVKKMALEEAFLDFGGFSLSI